MWITTVCVKNTSASPKGLGVLERRRSEDGPTRLTCKNKIKLWIYKTRNKK